MADDVYEVFHDVGLIAGYGCNELVIEAPGLTPRHRINVEASPELDSAILAGAAVEPSGGRFRLYVRNLYPYPVLVRRGLWRFSAKYVPTTWLPGDPIY